MTQTITSAQKKEWMMLQINGEVVAHFGRSTVNVALVEHEFQMEYFRARVAGLLPGQWCAVVSIYGCVEFLVFQKYLAYAVWKEEFADRAEILWEGEIL